MTTDQVLLVLKEFEVSVALDNGQPKLTGKVKALPPEMFPVLKWHREEIIKMLAPARGVECKWATGFIGKHSFPESGWPVGAGWWRHEGDTAWQPIPGRVGTDGSYQYKGPWLTEAARSLWQS